MRMGRPAKTPQPDYGRHLAELRNAASLSQAQLAEQLNVRQATVAAWERSERPPRGEFVVPLADALGVSLDTLLRKSGKAARHRGPASRLEELLDQASQLPKRRQSRIAAVLEAVIAQESAEAGAGSGAAAG